MKTTKRSLFLLVMFSTLASLPTMAVAKAYRERAVLRINCKELLDLATYAEYFDENVEFSEGDSKTFVLRTHFEVDKATAYTDVTFTLLTLNSEYGYAFVEAKWKNIINGVLINSDSEQLCLEHKEETILNLDTTRGARLFRNSCTMSVVE